MLLLQLFQFCRKVAKRNTLNLKKQNKIDKIKNEISIARNSNRRFILLLIALMLSLIKTLAVYVFNDGNVLSYC